MRGAREVTNEYIWELRTEEGLKETFCRLRRRTTVTMSEYNKVLVEVAVVRL